MDAKTKITFDAHITLTLTEAEAEIVAHLMGYDANVIVNKVTSRFNAVDLNNVARSLRSQLEEATTIINNARRGLTQGLSKELQ